MFQRIVTARARLASKRCRLIAQTRPDYVTIVTSANAPVTRPTYFLHNQERVSWNDVRFCRVCRDRSLLNRSNAPLSAKARSRTKSGCSPGKRAALRVRSHVFSGNRTSCFLRANLMVTAKHVKQVGSKHALAKRGACRVRPINLQLGCLKIS